MESVVQFTVRSDDGKAASGVVSEKSLRQMYKAPSSCLLAVQFSSEVGGNNDNTGEQDLPLPMTLDDATLNAVKDVLQDLVAQDGSGSDGEGRQPFSVRVPHGVAVKPFLAALDYLQVPLGDGPSFETVAAKWQHNALSYLDEVAKELVQHYLVPALLGGGMVFGPSSQTVVLFQHVPKKVGANDVVSLDWAPLQRCANIIAGANLVVFGSLLEKRPRSKGVKFYRIYATSDCWTPTSLLSENAVAWEDDFDTRIAKLFEGRFQRLAFRDVIMSNPAFKGLQVEVLDHADAVLLTAPWAA